MISVTTQQGTEGKSQPSSEAVTDVISTLYKELHHAQPPPRSITGNSHLDRDLGFGLACHFAQKVTF